MIEEQTTNTYVQILKCEEGENGELAPLRSKKAALFFDLTYSTSYPRSGLKATSSRLPLTPRQTLYLLPVSATASVFTAKSKIHRLAPDSLAFSQRFFLSVTECKSDFSSQL